MRHHIRLGCAFLALALLLVTAAPARAYHTVGAYHEGLCLVSGETGFGYCNSAGSLAIPLRYTHAEPFALGVALVEESGKVGLLRQDGTYCLPMIYDSLHYVDCGLYIATEGGVKTLRSVAPLPTVPTPKNRWLCDPAADIFVELLENGAPALVLLADDGGRTELPLSALPAALRDAGVSGAPFPTHRQRLPQFTDVSGHDWFDLWVNLAYSTGLMEGPGDGKFHPYKALTVGEALRLAATMDSRTAQVAFPGAAQPGEAWYQPSVDYCIQRGILSATTFDSYARAITRSELALVFASTALFSHSVPLNDLRKIQASIPDVKPGDPCADAIFDLYAHGVLTGSDRRLTFRPNDFITRSEVSAIVSRAARPEARIVL